MEVFKRGIFGIYRTSVGMRRPSGEYENPILGKRLFRTKPGNFVEFLFTTGHAFILKGIKTLAVNCRINISIWATAHLPLP